MELNKKEGWRTLKFVLFSASAGIIQIISFTLLNELIKWPYWPCFIIALTLSVLWNFTFNRRFTFKSYANVPKAMALVFLYYLIYTPLITIPGNYGTEHLGWNEYLVLGVSMFINLTTEYAYQRYVVYKRAVDQR